MLNRRHIRIKVMQTLFAFDATDGEDILKLQRFLDRSLNDMYELYLSLLALLLEIHYKAEKNFQNIENKLLLTEEDKDPNPKFVQNRVLKALSENSKLKEKFEEKKEKFWYLDFEYVDILYKAILKSEVYREYMSTKESNLKEYKDFIVNLYTEVIATNDQLYDYFEDKKLTWVDDFPLVNTMILKLFRKYKADKSPNYFLPPLIKEEEDREFAKNLLKKTVLKQHIYNKEIADKTTNWDSERIAKMDMVLLQMALCEFQEFKSIPFKVTINEYLEIAKEYSTPKSSIFINGILDKVVREYKAENKHNKVGRGLL
ncbi:MAG: transcription antitermination factor NusB [Flavobacteriaceae bacterium]|nr:transcription antitermination factor NusB [Flavobacteriaceae bacterium]